MSTDAVDRWQQVNEAFSKQSDHFDNDDLLNPILQEWRKRIYAYIDHFIKPNSKILELNAGTGIDSVRFVEMGHTVHATDISEGMISKLNERVISYSLSRSITVQRISFDQLDKIDGKFDYVFSNFGGLNC